jgi:ankyrin repeat protein
MSRRERLSRTQAATASLLLAALLVAGGARAQPAATGAARLKAMNVAFEPDRLVQFAGQGDAAVVEAFLEAGMSPDAKETRRGSTALIHAAANGHSRIVARLLDAGAAVNRPDDDGTTALAAACYFGRAPLVELLLAKGADPRAASKDGATSALEAAIWGGDARIVKMLLAAGADAVGDTREAPPLVRAAYTGRVEIVSALLEAKLPVSVVRRALEAARLARHAAAETVLSKALPP